MPATKRPTKPKPPPYWTPARVAALVEASGLGTQAEFAVRVRASESTLSRWLHGESRPSKRDELILDFLATEFGESASGNNR